MLQLGNGIKTTPTATAYKLGVKMNEQEKMISGKLYNPLDKTLEAQRMTAKSVCYKANMLPPDKLKERKDILKKILGKTGADFTITPNFFCDYGYNIELGDNFYSNHNLVILDCAKVTIGDNVLIGPNCGFYTACHPIDAKERITWKEFAKPITVGNNVWFGGNVCVMPGVTIGDNTVIGAGSVVTKDIPSNVVAAGNPCRVLCALTEKDKIFNIE